MMRNSLFPRWVDRRIRNKDGTDSIVSLYIDIDMSGSTTSPLFYRSSLFEDELKAIREYSSKLWEDAISQFSTFPRLLPLVPKNPHPFPRSVLKVPKNPAPHKGR